MGTVQSKDSAILVPDSEDTTGGGIDLSTLKTDIRSYFNPDQTITSSNTTPKIKKRVRIEDGTLTRDEAQVVVTMHHRPRRRSTRSTPTLPPDVETSITIPFSAVGFDSQDCGIAGTGLLTFDPKKKLANALEFLDKFDDEINRAAQDHIDRRKKQRHQPPPPKEDNKDSTATEQPQIVENK